MQNDKFYIELDTRADLPDNTQLAQSYLNRTLRPQHNKTRHHRNVQPQPRKHHARSSTPMRTSSHRTKRRHNTPTTPHTPKAWRTRPKGQINIRGRERSTGKKEPKAPHLSSRLARNSGKTYRRSLPRLRGRGVIVSRLKSTRMAA